MKLRVMQTLFPGQVGCAGLEDRELILYGAGDVGRHLLGSLLPHGIKPSFFAVSDEGLDGAVLNGLPVIGLSRLVASHRDALLVVASYAHHDEILERLVSAGFPTANISSWRAPEFHGTRYALVPEAEPVLHHVEGGDAPPVVMTRDCLYPWKHLIVNASGDVFPCFSLSDRYFGNLHAEIQACEGQVGRAVEKILASEAFRTLRQGLLTGRLCSMCQDCRGNIPADMIPAAALRDKVGRHLGGRGGETVLVDSAIRTLVVGPTRRCNLRCIYCVTSAESPPPGNLQADMPPEDLLGLVRALRQRGLESLNLWWDGEFTLYPGWPEIVRTLKQEAADLELWLTSNFSRPFNEAELQALSRFSRIDISCDTLDPELYAWIRRGGRLGVLLDNIERLQATCRGAGPALVLHGVLTDRVIHHLDAMADYCIERGLDLEFDNYQPIPGTLASSGNLLRSLGELDPEEKAAALASLEAMAHRMRSHGRRCGFLGDVLERLKPPVGVSG